MFVLNQSEPYDDPMSIDKDLVHLPQLFTLLNSFPRPEMEVSSYQDIRSALKVRYTKLTKQG